MKVEHKSDTPKALRNGDLTWAMWEKYYRLNNGLSEWPDDDIGIESMGGGGCQCGAVKHNFVGHSDWCPMFEG